ncbi:MAG: DEAD/DEAH box helicase [Gammaproteobacteria bacterium]|nr:DEAD/DEAH box helicase [Gammaproteobacteria bacterium]
MAEIESWESAIEFGVSEKLYTDYKICKKSDDLYIASLASVFDVLRLDTGADQKVELAAIAKTLAIYSYSAASKYLKGVDSQLNLLYSAALYYLADFPATATFLTNQIKAPNTFIEEEQFLFGFLSRKLYQNNPLSKALLEQLGPGFTNDFSILKDHLKIKQKEGLRDNPRLFIATKFSIHCLERFKEFNVWNILKQSASNYTYELWKPFLKNSHVFNIWELFPSQMTAIQAGILSDNNKTYSLQMPTSSGKTALCEILIYNEVKARKKRVLFLVPFRALAAEIHDGMSKRLETSGVNVMASYGGNIPTRSDTATIENADVLIATPEKFIGLRQFLSDLELQFQTIICDEGHLIDDSSRGLQYELLLTRLKSVEDSKRKFVFISAVLPNVNEIHEWLGGEPSQLAKSDYKPVEIDYAFLSPQRPSTTTWQLDFNPSYEPPRSYSLLEFLTQNDFKYKNSATDRLKLISGSNSYISLACAAALKACKNGPVALFTTTKGTRGVHGLASKLLELCNLGTKVADNLPLSASNWELIEYLTFQLGKNHLLVNILEYGIGFHHGGLPQEIRREIENGIQNELITILICTTTLAEGVNLPIRTLIIHTIRHHDGTRLRSLENRKIKNIIGRVGRAGKETRGRVIVVNDKERSLIERVLLDEDMQPAHGALYALIHELNKIVLNENIELKNEVFDKQHGRVLSLIDKIDLTLIDLIPANTPQDQISLHINEAIERTLAYRYCDNDQLRNCIKTVFTLRAKNLESSVPHESWRILRKIGASPRFLSMISTSNLLANPLWQTLRSCNNEQWLNEIVMQLIAISGIEINAEQNCLLKVIHGWIGGLTYEEISIGCNIHIDEALELLCQQIGYQLQELMAKLCQFAIEHHGEKNVSEMAMNWSSLLQYGLGSLQQLDMFNSGGSDRLGVWGISRFLAQNGVSKRGEELIQYLRANRNLVRTSLTHDARVPDLSLQRICKDLMLA